MLGNAMLRRPETSQWVLGAQGLRHLQCKLRIIESTWTGSKADYSLIDEFLDLDGGIPKDSMKSPRSQSSG